ncbi:RHS repeat-associated core domain-containing protein, partial [Pseudomonas syringae]|uniref:RHS repeat-associated core domain-containing protein n=1 Tax=Pseudomonas syringae TaxID=317 RepID=UPI0021801967
MSSGNRVVLCTYRYDPTDRLADCVPAGQGGMRLFYQKSRLATQIQGQIQHSLLRTDEHLLAHLSVENNQSDSALLLTDQQQSVIAAQGLALAYTPYGHRHPSAGPMNLPGFTGQRLDPVTGHYLLGNGYRAFNPVLMRFNSPDSLSPFDEGGLNAYGYVGGDPVGFGDETGHGKFDVINKLAARTAYRNRLSVSMGPLRMKGSSKLVASVPSSSEFSYTHPLPPNTRALPFSDKPGSVGWPGGEMTAATTAQTSAGPDSPIASTSSYRAGASSPRGASLSEQELKNTRARLSYSLAGGVSDSKYTAEKTLKIRQNRVANAKDMKEYYRGSSVKCHRHCK